MRFGFELEGFYKEAGKIALPPKHYPTDGFPGLCEVRTNGGKSLELAYFELLNEFRRYPFSTLHAEWTFTPEEKRRIRARHSEKTAVDIRNIYYKLPKALGNRTLASLQINFSRENGVTERGDTKYGLFDYFPIIKQLDEEFSSEIIASGRQCGWYAVKGDRVEYRSLPNTIFTTDLNGITALLNRITKACTIRN